MKMNNIFSKDFRIATYDVGGNGQISLMSLLRYFQEAAHEHANNLGVGYHKLREQNIFWVLSAMYIEINNLPGFDEKITINTWPRGVNKFYYLRDFSVIHNNQTVAIATSLWLTVDVNSKRIIRPDRITEGVDFNSDIRVFEEDFVQIEPINEKKLLEERFVRYSDLDINRHVNNVRYVEWLLDAVYNMVDEKGIKRLKIQYLSELVENEKAYIFEEKSDNKNEVKVEINHENGKTSIRALIEV